MASSVGFIRFVYSSDATQATKVLTLPPVGLTPTEHASLSWTHCLANITSSQNPVDGRLAVRHSTRDASHRADPRGDPLRVVDTARPPAQSSRPASPVGRPRLLES